MSPGIPVHVGEQKIETARITLMGYDQARLEEKKLKRCTNTMLIDWKCLDLFENKSLKAGKYTLYIR